MTHIEYADLIYEVIGLAISNQEVIQILQFAKSELINKNYSQAQIQEFFEVLEYKFKFHKSAYITNLQTLNNRNVAIAMLEEIRKLNIKNEETN